MIMRQGNQKLSMYYEFSKIIGAFIIFLLYLLIVNLWVFDAPFWRHDDPMILYQAMQSNVSRCLFDSEGWQIFSLFSPLYVISFVLDYKLAGLDASFFYYHHLLVIYLISCVTFIWLRSYIGNTRALLAGLLFLAGSPTFIVANLIMVRHYVEGLFFVVIFLIFYRTMKDSILHQWLGALFLFLALMEKEAFVIFLLYPFLKQNGLSFFRRLSLMIPTIILTFVFLIWRTIILNGIGGYGYPDASVWSKLLGFLSSIGKVFFGEGWLALFAAGGIAIVLIFTIYIYRHQLTLSPFLKIMSGTFVMLLVFFPAIVAINNPQEEYTHFTYHRYLFISWWAFSCLLMSLPNILASSAVKKIEAMAEINRLRSGIISFLILLTIMLLSIQNQNNHSFVASKSSIENLYRFAVGSGAGSILYCPDKYSFWYYDLQLRSLANVYMRPLVHLKYKDSHTGSDSINFIFDPSCACFKGIKKD